LPNHRQGLWGGLTTPKPALATPLATMEVANHPHFFLVSFNIFNFYLIFKFYYFLIENMTRDKGIIRIF